MKNPNCILSLIFLTIILILPSEISSWFNGLPWANTTETLTTLIAIPFLLIVGRNFLSKKSSLIALTLLLAFKLTLLGAPMRGWQVKISPDLKILESGNYTRTYFTLWQESISAILKKGWTDKRQFPLDWFTPVSEAPTESLNIVAGPLEKKFRQLSIWMTVEGIVRLPPNTQLFILTQGTGHEEVNAVSLNNEHTSIPLFHKLEEAKNLKKFSSTKQVWFISGKFNFFSDNWALQPFVINSDGQIQAMVESDFFWQDKSVIDLKDIQLRIYLFLAQIFDYGLLTFLLIWLFRAFQYLTAENIFSTPILFFSLLVTVLPWALAYIAHSLSLVRLPYPLNAQYLAISICITGAGLLAYSILKPALPVKMRVNLGHSIFLLFSPALLSYFTFRWWSDLGQISLWSLGDDWTMYQKLARLIILDGQWLTAGEPIFHHQPFYRYIVAFLHMLFGPSALPMRLADIWFLIGAAIILIHLAIRLGLSTFTIIAITSIFLAVGVGEFVHIGNGLAEFAALFFIMSAAFFLSQRPANYRSIFIAGGLATIGVWLHLDRIGVAGGITCLLINPQKGGVFLVWKNTLHNARNNWQFITTYLAILGAGLLAIILRNGFVGGRFTFVSENHPNFTGDLLWGNIFLLLTGKIWPSLSINTTAMITVLALVGLEWYFKLLASNKIRITVVTLGLISPFLFFYILDYSPFASKDWSQISLDTLFLSSVLAPGTLLGITALVWRPGPLKAFPLSIGIAMLGLLSPYLFLHIWGYAPRYSTQLLPWAAISLGFIINHVYNYYCEQPVSESIETRS
jgi:hypothetical protein